MSYAIELSNKIKELQYNALPAEAIVQAKVGILDTVGVTLAGATEDATRIVLGVSGSGSGPALVFGHARDGRARTAQPAVAMHDPGRHGLADRRRAHRGNHAGAAQRRAQILSAKDTTVWNPVTRARRAALQWRLVAA